MQDTFKLGFFLLEPAEATGNFTAGLVVLLHLQKFVSNPLPPIMLRDGPINLPGNTVLLSKAGSVTTFSLNISSGKPDVFLHDV